MALISEKSGKFLAKKVARVKKVESPLMEVSCKQCHVKIDYLLVTNIIIALAALFEVSHTLWGL